MNIRYREKVSQSIEDVENIIDDVEGELREIDGLIEEIMLHTKDDRIIELANDIVSIVGSLLYELKY